MRLRTLATATVTGVLAAVTMGTIAAGPAAAADDARCPNNSVCMYEDPNYSGSLYVNQVYDGNRHEIGGWNGDNEISSVINNTGSSIKIYANDGYSGNWHCVGAHATRSNLENNNFDNKAESWAFARC